jgi:superfamily II DNA or RNA helicase
MNPGDWAWSDDYQEPCRILEIQDLWGEGICRVWLPTRDTVVRVRADRLRAVRERGLATPARVVYAAAAARIADSLAHDTLLAPIESTVIPLPHQIHALSRAIEGDRVRYLLADEVGLGKTIEAGLIMRELKLRGLVRRTLVVVPKGLVAQWVAEMRTHFNEDFHPLIPGEFISYRRLDPDENLWRRYDQVVCPLDSVKPVDARRGWSRTDVAARNRERFDDLITAGWDLIIVDESHRLGGSTDQVARFRLGEGLAEASPYLLLLSATPHQGKTDAFHRLVSLLDRTAFPDPSFISRERVQPYVIRTEKRRAINAAGQPLFQPRYTRLLPVAWEERHARQRVLYEAVTEYVREGYDRARREKRHHIGFLMLLMQRLVTSSTRAIRSALERRLEVLRTPPAQLSLDTDFPADEWSDMDGQEQADAILGVAINALRNEGTEVEALLDAARTCEATGPDTKAETLLDLVYRLQQEEVDPALKILVFTEFVATQEMLRAHLQERGFSVGFLNGSMDVDERQRAQEAFAGSARVLISTDAGGEGLNLQFCHVVVNYDIPWNPMRLEQRIGRVDRIGQYHPVRAVNLVLADTVEYRVREVLEAKLAVILEEFGADKAADVLDSAEAGTLFDRLYAEALLDPSAIADKVDPVARQVRDQARAAREGAAMLAEDAPLDPGLARTLASHPMPYWIERMTTAYVAAFGGEAKRDGDAYHLVWPDRTEMRRAVFARRDPAKPDVQPLTLENAAIRELTTRLPRFVPGQPVPTLRLGDLSPEILGWWALWRVGAVAEDSQLLRIMPLFLHEDGRVLMPTARHLWDRFVNDLQIDATPVAECSVEKALPEIQRAAETHGHSVYAALAREHQTRLERERNKAVPAFGARRRAIGRIGLPGVRAHRLGELGREERAWRDTLDRRARVQPELTPILIVRIHSGAP